MTKITKSEANKRLRSIGSPMRITGEPNGIVNKVAAKCQTHKISTIKFEQYRPYCDQFYMAWPKDFGVDLPAGTGLLLPTARGHLRAARPASNIKMDGPTRKMLILRLAWRAGTYSKRNTRRTRIYL
jgi:hypothetical protein